MHQEAKIVTLIQVDLPKRFFNFFVYLLRKNFINRLNIWLFLNAQQEVEAVLLAQHYQLFCEIAAMMS